MGQNSASKMKSKRRSSRPGGVTARGSLATARRVSPNELVEMHPRRAKVTAQKELIRYAAETRRCNNVLELRRCSFQRVRAARIEGAVSTANGSATKWYCTPEAVVRSTQDVDGELAEDEAREEAAALLDDEREAAVFVGDNDDDGDETWRCEGDLGGDFIQQELGNTSLVMGREYEVDEEGFVYLLGTAVADWLRIRIPDAEDNSVILSSDEAGCWGLTEARDIEWAAIERFEEDVDMMVPADRLLFYDGNPEGRDLPTGLLAADLHPNCFYASSLEELREGFVPRWYPILLYTLQFFGSEGSESSGPHVTVVGSQGGDSPANGLATNHLVLRSTKMCLALDKVFASCRENPNRPERTDVLRSRPVSLAIQKHFCTSLTTFAQSRERECAKCAVLNALKALRPSKEEFLLEMAMETLPFRARCLSDVSKWAENSIRVLSVRYCTPKRPRDRESVSVKWILENTVDVLLVNLIGSGGVNHVVCVDSRADHRIIYDSMEEHPIYLNEESLRCCIGDGRVLQHIFARKVVIMPGSWLDRGGKRPSLQSRNGRKRRRRSKKQGDSEGAKKWEKTQAKAQQD